MIEAKVPLAVCHLVCKEWYIAIVTFLYRLVTTELNCQLQTRFKHQFGKIPRFAKKLRTWGEAGVVKTEVLAIPKVGDRGVTCILLVITRSMVMMYIACGIRIPKACFHPETFDGWDDIILTRQSQILSNPSAKIREDGSVTSREIGMHTDDTDDTDDEKSEDKFKMSDLDDSEDSEAEDRTETRDKDDWKDAPRTRLGRTVRTPSRLIEETSAVVGFTHQEAVRKLKLSNIESSFYAVLMNLSCAETNECEMEEVDKVHLQEYACVGAGTGGRFQNTKELHVMKYKEAMNTPDRVEWEGAVEKEHHNMQKYGVWTPVRLQDLPEGTKVLTSTWAMKKKANGTHRARAVARGFEQIKGVCYDGASIAAPVTNGRSIRIIMVLALMSGWATNIVDVKGAFLHGEF